MITKTGGWEVIDVGSGTGKYFYLNGSYRWYKLTYHCYFTGTNSFPAIRFNNNTGASSYQKTYLDSAGNVNSATQSAIQLGEDQGNVGGTIYIPNDSSSGRFFMPINGYNAGATEVFLSGYTNFTWTTLTEIRIFNLGSNTTTWNWVLEGLK